LNPNLVKRLLTAAIAIPVVIAIVHWGDWLMYAFILSIGLISFWEYSGIVTPQDRNGKIVFSLLGTATILVGIIAQDPVTMMLIIQAAGLALAIFYMLAPGDMENAWSRLSALAFGFIYIALAHTCICLVEIESTRLQAEHVDTIPGVWVYLMLIATWSNDTAAYFSGRAFGKHKLYEKISPKKTWEGFAGGAIGSACIPVAFVVGLNHWMPSVTYVDALWIGIPAAFLAPVGDLVESMLKRSYNIKDSGGVLPGHGGLLDRVDAVYFVAPWVLFYVHVLRAHVS
jgi:phosphatidate cytidylyltransferase